MKLLLAFFLAGCMIFQANAAGTEKVDGPKTLNIKNMECFPLDTTLHLAMANRETVKKMKLLYKGFLNVKRDGILHVAVITIMGATGRAGIHWELGVWFVDALTADGPNHANLYCIVTDGWGLQEMWNGAKRQ